MVPGASYQNGLRNHAEHRLILEQRRPQAPHTATGEGEMRFSLLGVGKFCTVNHAHAPRLARARGHVDPTKRGWGAGEVPVHSSHEEAAGRVHQSGGVHTRVKRRLSQGPCLSSPRTDCTRKMC